LVDLNVPVTEKEGGCWICTNVEPTILEKHYVMMMMMMSNMSCYLYYATVYYEPILYKLLYCFCWWDSLWLL